MSFWNLGEETPQDGQFDMGGGFEPIPNNTDVLAAPDEAKWDTIPNDGEDYISIRWEVMAPEDYKGRKIYQKVRVYNEDDKKAQKAKRMLAAIDQNAGGKLMASGEEPTDESLTVSLCNKPMVLKVMKWEIPAEQSNDGQHREGNWVSAVSPRKKGGGQKKQEAPKKEEKAQAPEPEEDPDDDVPF